MSFDKIVLIPKVGGGKIREAKVFADKIRSDSRFLKQGIFVTEDCNDADEHTLIVPVGGDGTVLHAAKLAAANGSTILGVNLGNVGFLADLPAQNAIESLLTINDDTENPNWISDSRILISLFNKNGEQTEHVAFNDFAISDSLNGKTIRYDLSISGQHAGNHRANGVIISTPTGSTGYSLSAGGPILLPSAKAIAITPVAPISLSSRSIIIGSESKITLTIEHPRPHSWYPTRQQNETISSSLVIKSDGLPLTDYMMTRDFIVSHDSENVTYQIGIEQAKNVVKMIHPTGYNYFSILKEKLGWNS